MTKIDTSIKNLLAAASWCDNNNLPHLAFCFDGAAMDALSLASNKKLASLNHCDITIKTAGSAQMIKGSRLGPEPKVAPSQDLLYAMGKAAEGGIVSMTRLAQEGRDWGKTVSNVADWAGLVPGLGKYLRGGGEFVGNLMQGKGLGSALGAGAMGFGLGALPPTVQLGLKGVEALINYLQTLDLSKVPFLQPILENLKKWVPMIASGISYALMLGVIKQKPEGQQGQPQIGAQQAPKALPAPQGEGGMGLPQLGQLGQLAGAFAATSNGKMTKTSNNKSLVFVEIVDNNKNVLGYGTLPKSLYAATVAGRS